MNELFLIVISLAFGSFGNNVISYFSGQSKFDLVRSHCMCGEKILNVKEMIPVVSYIYFKGRCVLCKTELPLRYLIIELLAVIIGFLCYYFYSLSVITVLNFFLFFGLLLIGTIDLISFTIPNILLAMLLLISVLRQYIISIEFFTIQNLILCFIPPLFFILMNYLFMKFCGKNAIGFGDIKLIFVLTLMFQILTLVIGIWISSIIAIIGFYLLKIFSSRFKEEYRVPFGFFLSIGFLILGFLEKPVIDFYYKVTGL